MFKLVFLLIFSAAAAIGGREITLDIHTKRDRAGRYNLMCDVAPSGTQHVLEGDKIKFNVQTRSNLQDFWCNAYGKTICTLGNTEKETDDGNIQTWKLSGNHSSYQKATMDGSWTCIFRIKKPHHMELNAPTIPISSVDYIEGKCELQFQITEPEISLSITQLKAWSWTNQKQRKKRYNDTFTEGEKRFDCVLNNPTDREETYTLSFIFDNVPQERKPKVVIKPRDKMILTDTFKLNSTSSLIICSATNVKGTGPNLENAIHLQYIPAPLVFLHMQTINSNSLAPQKLTIGQLFRENNTQFHDYNYTDGEQVTFNCALNNAEGDEKRYALTLCIEGKNCAKSEGGETSISHEFILKREDEFKKILCTAFNKNSATTLLPSHLYSIIDLHYRPREPTETATPKLSITGPEKLLRTSDTIYHYTFTHGEIVELKCSLNNVAKSEKNYDIVLFHYNVSTNKNDFVTSSTVLKTPLCVYHTFTLKKEDKAIRCGAFSNDKYEKKYSIDVFLHYTPQPTQVLPYHNGSRFKMDVAIKETNQNKTCVVRKNKMPIQTSVLKLKQKKKKTSGGAEVLCWYCWCWPWQQCPTSQVPSPSMQPPQSASAGVELNMDGLPPGSCYATDLLLKTTKICTYTFGDPDRLGKTLPLTCVMKGKWVAIKKAEYKIQFETNSAAVIFTRYHFSKKRVSYEIPLKEGNNTVTCTAARVDVDFKLTIIVNIAYIPPTTPIEVTEPSTTSIKPSLTNQGPTESSDAALQSSTGDEEETGAGAWLKWVLIGGVLIGTICVVAGCIVMYRQKKPPPAESTYANLGKDMNTYQTMPVPAPRTVPKPTTKPKVTMENNYSEPKDSQDMSEALYADPQRFNGDSETYAEPYVKSKSSPQSDTYAEPYKPNYAEPYASISEGNYAELSLPDDGKELYARPVPKAQRKPKVKDEANYSNVFIDQYANTRK